jgi:hypothetical protein
MQARIMPCCHGTPGMGARAGPAVKKIALCVTPLDGRIAEPPKPLRPTRRPGRFPSGRYGMLRSRFTHVPRCSGIKDGDPLSLGAADGGRVASVSGSW